MTTQLYFQVLTFMTLNTKLPDDQPLIISSSYFHDYLHDIKHQITRLPTTYIFKFLLSWFQTLNYLMTNPANFLVLTTYLDGLKHQITTFLPFYVKLMFLL